MKIYIILFAILCTSECKKPFHRSNFKKPYRKPRFDDKKAVYKKIHTHIPEKPHFEDATKSPFFIDKTMLLKDFIGLPSGQSFVMLTCPDNFGKSTNLDMARRFFQIEVDKITGRRVDKTTTMSYKFFTNEKANLSIARDKAFIEKHFGEYPVIYLSFLNAQGGDAKQITSSLCQIIRNLLVSHEWLYNIMKEKFDGVEEEKANLEIFADLLKKEGDDWDSINGLSTLINYLTRHYNKKLILLIDDFDLPLTQIITNGIYTEETMTFLETVLCTFLKDNNCTSHAIIAGVTHLIKVCESTKTDNIDHWYFLNNHRFSEYFGFTETDISYLLDLKFTADYNQIKNHFNGYQILNKNASLYEPKGVVRHLESKSFQEIEISEDDAIHKIMKCLQHKSFLEEILKLISAEPVSFELLTCSEADGLDTFVKMIRQDCSEFDKGDINMYFTHLFENGFLSYASDPEIFRIPNTLAQEKIKLELKEHYRRKFGIEILNSDVTNNLNDIINNINTTKELLESFTSCINQLIQSKTAIIDDYHLHTLIFAAIYCNVNTSGEIIKVKKTSASNNETITTGINDIILLSENKKTLLIMQLTNKKKTKKAVEQARKMIPSVPKNSSSITMVKYVGLNLDNLGRLEAERGPNIFDW